MSKIFNAAARDKIAATVNKVLGSPRDPGWSTSGAGDVLGGGSTPGAGTLLMGKVVATIDGSAEDWSEMSCGTVNIFSGACPVSSEAVGATGLTQPYDPETGSTPPLSVKAINPGCTFIDAGTPVVIGKEASGNWVIIWAMCSCSGY